MVDWRQLHISLEVGMTGKIVGRRWHKIDGDIDVKIVLRK